MSLSIRILNSEVSAYKQIINSNNNIENSISKNDKTKNISDLNVSIKNDKLLFTWHDCINAYWKRNLIIRSETTVPINTFDGNLLKITDIKNEYAIKALIDSNNIIEDKLYCYRVFTEFENSDELYSSYKNIFFIYIYDDEKLDDGEIDEKMINAATILTDELHRFVTDEQIEKYENYQHDINEINVSIKDMNYIISTLRYEISLLQDRINKLEKGETNNE